MVATELRTMSSIIDFPQNQNINLLIVLKRVHPLQKVDLKGLHISRSLLIYPLNPRNSSSWPVLNSLKLCITKSKRRKYSEHINGK